MLSKYECNVYYISVSNIPLFVNSWMSKVSKDDVVYMIGDEDCANFIDNWSKLLKDLPGHKHLIASEIDEKWGELGIFESMNSCVTLIDNGRYVTLCSYPMINWPYMKQGGWYIFGMNTNETALAYAWKYERMLDVRLDFDRDVPTSLVDLWHANEEYKRADMNSFTIRKNIYSTNDDIEVKEELVFDLIRKNEDVSWRFSLNTFSERMGRVSELIVENSEKEDAVILDIPWGIDYLLEKNQRMVELYSLSNNNELTIVRDRLSAVTDDDISRDCEVFVFQYWGENHRGFQFYLFEEELASFKKFIEENAMPMSLPQKKYLILQ